MEEHCWHKENSNSDLFQLVVSTKSEKQSSWQITAFFITFLIIFSPIEDKPIKKPATLKNDQEDVLASVSNHDLSDLEENDEEDKLPLL